ncbi:hypothetical protein Tco_0179790 [Tanacetum coccineum]
MPRSTRIGIKSFIRLFGIIAALINVRTAQEERTASIFNALVKKAIDSQSTQTIKLPILQPGEYDLWKMRMEQYLQCIDYTLWEIIENGNAPIVTKTIDGKETVIPPTSVEEKAQRGFRGNTAIKKTQINPLKQLYENFAASSTEVIEQTYETLQKLISQLEMHEHCYADYEGKKIPEEYWKEGVYGKPRIRQQDKGAIRRTDAELKTRTLNAFSSSSVMAWLMNGDDQSEEGPTYYALMAYSSPSLNSFTNSLRNLMT